MRALNRFFALFLGLTCFGVATANAAATTTHVRDKGTFALFVSTNGDIQTITQVFTSSLRENSSGSGGPTTSPVTSVLVLQVNTATQQVLLNTLGSTSDHVLDIAHDLSSASVQATVEMFDVVNETIFSVAVDVSWASTGEPVTEHSVIRFSESGIRVTAVFKGTQQAAVASGTVTGLSMNFTPTPSDTAQIQDNKTDSVVTIEQ
jgi:hypothetical protein